MNEIITNNAIDLTPLLQALIALIGVIITAYVIPYVKARTTKEQQQTLRDVVHIGVYAAEKIYGGGRGKEKLKFAEDYIYKHYNARVNTDALMAMIDAEIKEMESKAPIVIEEAALEEEEPAEDEEEGIPPDKAGV